jgi:hypothetical protein
MYIKEFAEDAWADIQLAWLLVLFGIPRNLKRKATTPKGRLVYVLTMLAYPLIAIVLLPATSLFVIFTYLTRCGLYTLLRPVNWCIFLYSWIQTGEFHRYSHLWLKAGLNNKERWQIEMQARPIKPTEF